jgi:hypothetical protein
MTSILQRWVIHVDAVGVNFVQAAGVLQGRRAECTLVTVTWTSRSWPPKIAPAGRNALAAPGHRHDLARHFQDRHSEKGIG